MTVRRLLVANRGEIAARVIHTCRRLGIETVAVHSDADAGLPFVAAADLAVPLPGNRPAETYLDVPALLRAARRTGADAVHPGYGFLSENAGFARAVLDAGLTWIGPDPESIAQMGSKVEAKRIMREAGVPVLEAPVEPTAADLPLIVKASAGGGGRGMRVVRSLDALDTEVEAARAEADSAFGDGTVFLEPYVEHGRHVEVQVVGDRWGDVLVLGERDCSLQRRHQKVLEESPAPGLSDATRKALHEAAHRAAAAIGYLGAGTVEFLLDPETERFWFLEMNTRLQVEHPVTESVHGVDLVALQIAVAEGGPVSAVSPHRDPLGHAIEARVYAEDPTADHRPDSGRLVTLDVPHDSVFGQDGYGVRLDAGYADGTDVSTFYDAMLAKVVAWAPSRAEAARLLAAALRRTRIHGVRTNRDQLLAVLAHPEFLAGEVHTGFLEGRDGARLSDPTLALCAAVAALVHDERGRRTVQRGVPPGWRNVVSQPQTVTFEVDGQQHTVGWLGGRDGIGFPDADVRVLSVQDGRVRVESGGIEAYVDVRVDPSGLPGTREVHVDGPDGYVRLREVPRFTDPDTAHRTGSLLAPMPGTVVGVVVAAGERVAPGQPVLVLEAMKMQHTVAAPHAGTVTEIDVRPGQQVAAGDVLAVVMAGDDPTEAEEQG